MMFPGALYSTGVISPYIKSYYGMRPDSSWSQDILPLCQVLGTCIMPFGSYLVQQGVNTRIMIGIGEAVALACFILASQMSSFAAFTAFYVFGFGSQNFVYMVPIH